MKRATRIRLWIESTMAAITGVLFAVTLMWPDWVEKVLHVSPDRGDGSAERMIVVVLALATAALILRARVEWRRARAVVDPASR